jgi:outer membrane protein assembly factor BamE (lipoprotein component of BamABCDE complex)
LRALVDNETEFLPKEADCQVDLRIPFIAILAAAALSACMSAESHRAAVSDSQTDKLTVGTVQRSIRTGMSGAEVAEVLGSPNVVTTDEQRREVWIYDKVSTETAYSTSDAYGTILILGASQSAGAVSTTQKTLTVIVKFDEAKKVRDFAYHSSQF